jgi:D-glycero-D-manno-heptose 1,7-bisphosphate phosphatase
MTRESQTPETFTFHISLFTLNLEPKKRAVFLDRDGTINVEKEYLFRIEDFEFIEGAPEAIRRLREAGYLVVVVTNQSGVARGYFSLDDVEKLHRHLQQELARFGTAVDAFYVCPHHPRFGEECDCRKGSPGMLLKAAEEHRIELGISYMVGDKAADIEAGQKAGCTSLLVLTGYGPDEGAGLEGVPRFPDLAGAADFILSRGGPKR